MSFETQLCAVFLKLHIMVILEQSLTKRKMKTGLKDKARNVTGDFLGGGRISLFSCVYEVISSLKKLD